MEDVLTHAIAVLATTPARWVNLVEGVPAALLTRSPAPGEWSALQCLGHLVDTEREVFPVRVEAFLAGRDLPAFDPDAAGTPPGAAEDPVALAAEFAARRTASLERLRQVTRGDLARGARHAELGPVTLEEMLHEWAGHDLMHTVQGERAMLQPFIDGSGPWRGYFADHDLAARTAG